MNILQVSFLDSLGGAARIAWTLHQGYKAQGINSSMAVEVKLSQDPAVYKIPASVPSDVPERLLYLLGQLATQYKLKIGKKGIGEFLQRLSRSRHWWTRYWGREDFDFSSTSKLFDLSGSRPDIVHLHNLHNNYFNLRFLPTLSKTIPTLITLHDMWLLSGHCAYPFDCMRWKTGCGACPYLGTPPAINKDATAYNWQRKKNIYADSKLYLAFPSKWIMQKIAESILAPAVVDSRIIHNGVDLSVFFPIEKRLAREKLKLSPDALVILFVAVGSSANVFKDFTTIHKALEVVSNQWIGKRIIFVALGGKESISGIGNIEIIVVPYINDLQEVARYYQAADLYIHASRADTFPTVVLEALACGTPVIATGVGGTSEQIKEGETGFITPPADPFAMANSVLYLLKEDELRNRLSIGAALDAKKRFGHERMIGEYLTYYKEITRDWQSRIGNK